MKILQNYILRHLIRNFVLCLMAATFLFLVFDFFDRIDNLIAEGAAFWLCVQYFLFKIPLTLTFMLPVAMLVATLLTYGLLSKSSEITAMRASGCTIIWLAKPLIVFSICVSFASILLSELGVPYATRRVKEIYNIDIRQKDKRGGYSQSDFWWRSVDDFLSVGVFDSRSNTMLDVSKFRIRPDFSIAERLDAKEARYLNPLLGWNMRDLTIHQFPRNRNPEVRQQASLPLPITDQPEDFYAVKTEPETMSFRQLNRFIKEQTANGISTTGYLADLYSKIAFPFVCLVGSLVALPFALKPARSGSLATSFIAGLTIGFAYYAIHSFSIAMGRAELWSPFVAAWMANIVMGFVAFILSLGAEAP